MTPTFYRHLLVNVLLAAILAALVTFILPTTARAGVAGAAGRAAAKSAARMTPGQWRAVLRTDRIRDLHVVARPLKAPVTVRKYTTIGRAFAALRKGLRAGVHFTAPVRAGRLPGGATAMKQYGLQRRPTAAIKVRLPKGTWVRRSKVIAGQPGRGELTTLRSTPPAAIKKAARIKP
jgi:hypothetical protein